jgi:hypothetical protein
MEGARRWAEEEFGAARLGDARRTRRLVRLASEVAAKPAGTVTQVCASSASREGAFRLLENDAVKWQPIAGCVREATMRRCRGREQVFVAVDATSLHITDEQCSKGIGSIGAADQGARGVHAMTALAVSNDGAPLGIVEQKLWVRESRSPRGEGGRPKHGGESAFWCEVLGECRTAFVDGAADTTPWYQLDRGGDCWQVLDYASDEDVLLTVRATHDRRLDDARHLWEAVERAKVFAKTTLQLPAKPSVWRKKRVAGRRHAVRVAGRRPRIARLSIRATTVSVLVTTPEGSQPRVFNVVLVRETHRAASDRVEWLLLTTHPIATRADVLAVVRGYSMRWRVEDFHRAWKRGHCNVEDTQLRSREALYKWVTLLAAVATRAQRLAHQARLTPQALATSELTAIELTALLALRAPKVPPPDPLTLQQAVRWIAELGGYIGPWNGPPGPTVIGRGLYDLGVAVRVLENTRKKR